MTGEDRHQGPLTLYKEVQDGLQIQGKGKGGAALEKRHAKQLGYAITFRLRHRSATKDVIVCPAESAKVLCSDESAAPEFVARLRKPSAHSFR